MPYCNTNQNSEVYYIIETNDIKLISDYTRLNFIECLELDILTYKVLLKDAYIYRLEQSEQGKEYLKNCWYEEQTVPDFNTLKSMFGG